MPKVKGYIRLFGRYVSEPFLLKLLMVLLAVCIGYLGVAHPYVVRFWYSRQTLPSFKLDSPYLASYRGRALLWLSDGSLLYEGDINGPVIEGVGTLYLNDRVVYEGSFQDGRYNGMGTLYTDSGYRLYSGGFKDNAYHGSGVLYGEDGGAIYNGLFEDGLFHGTGTLHFLEDEIAYTYVGAFEAGMRTGEGRLFCGDTLVYEGSFLEGEYSGGTCYNHGEWFYDGGFENGQYEGYGRLRADGLLYEGSFSEGQYEGSGRLSQNGALLYLGEFSAGLYNGSGTEYDPETGYKVFEGRYLSGERMKAGTDFDENGEPLATPLLSLDPVSQLSAPYEDACATLIKAGVEYRSIPPLEGYSLLIDDKGGIIYALSTDSVTGEPLLVSHVYLCSLYASYQVVIGSDIRDVTRDVSDNAEPGTITEPGAAFALALSNLSWNRTAVLSDIGSITYIADDKRVTAYYVADTKPEQRQEPEQEKKPGQTPEPGQEQEPEQEQKREPGQDPKPEQEQQPEAEAELATKEDGEAVIGGKEATESTPNGIILFLKVEPL